MKQLLKLVKSFSDINKADTATVVVMTNFEKYLKETYELKKANRVKSDYSKFQSAVWDWINQNQHIDLLAKNKNNNLMKTITGIWNKHTTKDEDKTVLDSLLLDLIEKHNSGAILKDYRLSDLIEVKTVVDELPKEEPKPKPEPKPEPTTTKIKVARKKAEPIPITPVELSKEQPQTEPIKTVAPKIKQKRQL